MENLFNNILFGNIRELENLISTIISSSGPHSSGQGDIFSYTGSSFNYDVPDTVENNDDIEIPIEFYLNNDRLEQGMRFLNNLLYSSETFFNQGQSNNLHNESSSINHNRQSPRFGISRYLDNERILYSRRYDPNDYETAEIIFFELRDEWKQKNNITSTCDIDTSRSITISLKNILLDFYNNENEEERFPNLEEFLEKIFIFKCNCLEHYNSSLGNQDNIKKILEYYCMFYGRYPRCNEFPFILEFYLIQKTFPTEEELEEHIYRSIQFSLNPEEYHQNDKEFIPTIGIDKLPVLKYRDLSSGNPDICSSKLCCFQNTCAICQEDFSENQDVIKLTPCNHLFHSTNIDCLENASIRNWLEKYNHCPLCKQKIKVSE
jgi:hypothetical protein